MECVNFLFFFRGNFKFLNCRREEEMISMVKVLMFNHKHEWIGMNVDLFFFAWFGKRKHFILETQKA